MQHIKNVIPSFNIIAETKLNEEGFRAFFSKSKPNFFTSFEEKNKTKISDCEKLIEATGQICDILESDRTPDNRQYIAAMLDNCPDILNHAFVTVAFNNVSQTFIDKMHKMHAKIEVSQRELTNEELKFWLLPTYEDNEELALKFAELFQSYGTLKVTLEEDLKKHKERDIVKDLECIKRLLPNTYALDAVITANIMTWKNIALKYTDYMYDDEVRYVLLFLAKALKQRYQNIFYNIGCMEKTGLKLGLDSLKTNGKIWRTVKLIESE
jgi:hypothetical protein